MPICAPCFLTCQHNRVITSGSGQPPRCCVRWCAHLVGRCSRSTDDLWVVDSTPVECGRSRETAKRSDLAGWAEYGYCASHSRYFWGLRLHLLCTAVRVAGCLRADRHTGRRTPHPAGHVRRRSKPAERRRRRQTLISDKNYYGKQFEAELVGAWSIALLRPARQGEKTRAGQRFFKPLRQVIESINNTFKAQLDLERHGGRTIAGVTSRVLQRVLALTAAIWHNDQPASPLAITDRIRPLTPWNYSSSLGWRTARERDCCVSTTWVDRSRAGAHSSNPASVAIIPTGNPPYLVPLHSAYLTGLPPLVCPPRGSLLYGKPPTGATFSSPRRGQSTASGADTSALLDSETSQPQGLV